MNLLGEYTNGNYKVMIYDDGTKVRFNDEDHLTPEFPESLDIKITNMCDINCPFCHEDSKPDGTHGRIMKAKFIDTLHPYTELAIGGGNPLSHPQLITFLKKCKDLKLIPNITINQDHFLKNLTKVKYLVNNQLIYGLGVSMTVSDDEFINAISMFPNAVIHVIVGNVNMWALKRLAHKDLKILFLGYKDFRRGKYHHLRHRTTINDRICVLSKHLKEVMSWFKIASFDNLAIEQLNLREVLSVEEWSKFYMGDDGQFTMYVDLVAEEFAKSSTSTQRYKMLDSISTMFEIVRNEPN